jgi:protein-S-isoprenylcysteine O-methyltransferase Ste14
VVLALPPERLSSRQTPQTQGYLFKKRIPKTLAEPHPKPVWSKTRVTHPRECASSGLAMAPKTPTKKSPASASGRAAPPTSATPASSTKKKKPKSPNCIRHAKYVMALTGPLNLCLFLPGMFVYNAVKEGGWSSITPLFGYDLQSLVGIQSADDAVTLLTQPNVLKGLGLAVGAAILIWIGLVMLKGAIDEFHAAGGTLSGEDPPLRLVTTGIYAYVRNPAYIATVLIIVGVGVVVGLQSVLIYAAVYWLGIWIFLGCKEDAETEERFGTEWIQYAQNVGPWLPRCSPYNPNLLQV